MTIARAARIGALVGLLAVGVVDAAGLIRLPGVSCVLLAVLLLAEA